LIKEFQDDSVINFDKNPSPFFNKITTIGNILDLEGFDKIFKDVETVILLAAEHRDDVSPISMYYDVNVRGTKNILDKMDKFQIKNLVFTSSVAVYGLNKKNPNENHKKDPFNHYGKSKWLAEQAIKEWYDNNPVGKSVTIIRPTVIFGERNRGNVYNLLKQISSGKFIMIGKGDNIKSMAYVGNVVAFIKSRLLNKKMGYQIFNYVDKPDYKMNELVSIIETKMELNSSNFKLPYWLGYLGGLCFDFFSLLSGKKFPISAVRVKKFCATTQFDAEKVHKCFDAPFKLKNGLDKTLEHEFINPKEDDILFYSE
tara:strand:- start:564 stop:1502 length:939 start_codon:yes stop_codon:yes gene_type:complete